MTNPYLGAAGERLWQLARDNNIETFAEELSELLLVQYESGLSKVEQQVIEVFTGLDDCPVQGIPPEWDEKPLLRIKFASDRGDMSVGIWPSSAWVLDENQNGTVLNDLLNEYEAKR